MPGAHYAEISGIWDIQTLVNWMLPFFPNLYFYSSISRRRAWFWERNRAILSKRANLRQANSASNSASRPLWDFNSQVCPQFKKKSEQDLNQGPPDMRADALPLLQVGRYERGGQKFVSKWIAGVHSHRLHGFSIGAHWWVAAHTVTKACLFVQKLHFLQNFCSSDQW